MYLRSVRQTNIKTIEIKFIFSSTWILIQKRWFKLETVETAACLKMRF